MAVISRANNEKTIQQRYGASNFRNFSTMELPMPRHTRFEELPHHTLESITKELPLFTPKSRFENKYFKTT